ncbi:hypothetical protein [Thiocapsa rosea]|uniref:Uncharacterized protein n=1 Tax=Thiocapsa rosea TaxID=69360 RepID=A0A495V0F2_9GAMM|nr:hypothetical protein [Thiocapsa rosea]RKT42941.1 hypothetical protein BDD21_0243 [Thiocapsa rosea]
MRFAIERPLEEDTVPVWNDTTALQTLDRLIVRADEAAHDVLLLDADLLDDSEWFQGARQTAHDRLLELCELARASAWDSGRAETTTWQVTTSAEAGRALRIANSPLKVLVESRLRDGALLDVAVRLLAREPVRRLWITPPIPLAMEVLHAGGTGDMPGFMEQEANNAREAELPLRLIVVVDSDRTSPKQPPSSKAAEIEQKARELGARPFTLTKHEAENYIPDFHWHAELARDPRNPRWAKEMTDILSMPSNDRDYCDMEK